LTGFPWLQLGYSATDSWFASWATISGVIGVSFVLATIAGLIAHAIQVGQRAEYRNMVISVVFISLASWVLSSVRWTEQVGDALDVTLVQADIPLADKWAPEKRDSIMQIYLAASQAVKQTDLIVWPEAALPMVMNEIPAAYLDELRALEGALIFGGIETEKANSSSRAYNGLALLQDDQWQVYRKQHLVPFGEYFPL
jgi:apolipoprotein N-acyltransferase